VTIETLQRIDDAVTGVERSYGRGEERPLRAFAGIMATYAGSLAALSWLSNRHGRLRGLSPEDLALYGVATHKLSRILTKAPVTSPLRAPFTQLEGTDGPAELHEEVRGDGWRHAVGELVSCPFCAAQWIGTGFVFGGMWWPALTRAVAGTFVVHAISDVLQLGYTRAEARATAPVPTERPAPATDDEPWRDPPERVLSARS
jgi:hypothetical protein